MELAITVTLVKLNMLEIGVVTKGVDMGFSTTGTEILCMMESG